MRAFLSLRGAKRCGNPRPLWVRSPSQKWGTDSHGGLWPPRNDRTGNGWADHPDRCLTVGAGSKPARVIFPTEPVAMGRGAPACAPGIEPTAGRHTGRSLPVEMGWTVFGSPSGGAGAASAVPERACAESALSASLRSAPPPEGEALGAACVRFCHCEERSDAAICVPFGCVPHRRNGERIPTAACGRLGMTEREMGEQTTPTGASP